MLVKKKEEDDNGKRGSIRDWSKCVIVRFTADKGVRKRFLGLIPRGFACLPFVILNDTFKPLQWLPCILPRLKQNIIRIYVEFEFSKSISRSLVEINLLKLIEL